MVKKLHLLLGLIAGLALAPAGFAAGNSLKMTPAANSVAAAASPHAGGLASQWGFLDKYCSNCHNATDWAGGVAFDTLTPEGIGDDAAVWEEAVRRLRGALMPPPGEPQPDRASTQSFYAAMEQALDKAAQSRANPGTVVLHRLNRPEYETTIRELLDLDIDASTLLPRDDSASGFDNVAEVLKVTPSFLEQYLAAARQVSIDALGSPNAHTTSVVYAGDASTMQYMQKADLPLGTRGGFSIEHLFPADGEYEVTISGLVGGGYVWGVMDPFTLIVTLDGDRVFAAQVGGEEDLRAIDVEQAVGLSRINERFSNIKVKVPAGVHRIGVTYKQKTAAEHDEVLHGFSSVAGMGQMVNGNSGGPRISNVEIKGPLKPMGVSETPSRRKLLICRPSSAAEETPCAKRIFATLAKRAFRRPVTDADLAGAMAFYAEGRKDGTFDAGIQKGVMAILASPKFLYRYSTPPMTAKPGDAYQISDLELASRLSFFLWSTVPDEQLIDIAAAGRLREPGTLEAQVRRMLSDPRARSLATNFASQWLNLRGLDLVNPDTNLFPEYTEDLIPAFREEIYAFVWSIFGEDRSAMDLLGADWTFLNERLAVHYGIPGVRGGHFRRVQLSQSWRRGLLGKGGILMATSYANRTSPVVRGAYLLEHLMGTPPTAPPPGVEAFPESQEGGEQLTVRFRLESHRSVKSCHGCHGVIDPLGVAMENYDALGQYRSTDIDAGVKIDAGGEMADGTKLNGVDALREVLLSRPDQFVQTLTENLMTYALGRSLHYFDMPRVRQIVRDAAAHDYRFSSLVLGIVTSPEFQTDRVPGEEPPEKAKVTVAATSGG
jgi:mono/diheme cytochrome c family protein